jgi:hypothetical protein
MFLDATARSVEDPGKGQGSENVKFGNLVFRRTLSLKRSDQDQDALFQSLWDLGGDVDLDWISIFDVGQVKRV